MRTDAASLGAAARTTIAVLAGIGSFASFAGLFGGGWAGFAAATLMAFGVFWVTLFLLTRRTTKATIVRENGKETKVAEHDEVSTVRLISPTKVVRGPRLQVPAGKIANDDRVDIEEAIRASGSVCDPGPYKVDGGAMVWIEMDVRKGERVRGRLSELYSNDFDWHIVDERNLILAQNREDFSPARSGDHVSADRVQWRFPKEGPWFIVLDLYGRSNERRIEIDLRRS